MNDPPSEPRPDSPTETAAPFSDTSETLLANAKTVRTPPAESPFEDSGPIQPLIAPDELPEVRGYHVERELGRGGMGAVYLAVQDPPGRKVALKVVQLQPPYDKETALRFQREVGAVAKLEHPNIVTVFEVGASERLLHFSMTLIDGETLKDAIYGGRVDLRAGLEIVRRMADALHCAHQRGIVHRDVKPENIIVARDGTPYLTDFGLARDLAKGAKVTQTGAIAGTPLYMSPEQASAAPGLDHRTDIYSLGATLYEALALRPPLQGRGAVEVLAKIANEEPKRLRRLDPKIPRDVETIVEKAMRKDRNDRYTDAAAFADDLGRFLEGRPISARPVPSLVRLYMLARRNPAVTSLLAAILVAGVVLAGWGAGVRAERLTFQEACLERALKHHAEGEQAFAAAQELRASDAGEAVARADAAEQHYLKALDELGRALALGAWAAEPLVLRARLRQRFLERAEIEADTRMARLLLTDLEEALRTLPPGRDKADLSRFARGAGRLELRLTPAEGVWIRLAEHPEGEPPQVLPLEGGVKVIDPAPMGDYALELHAEGYERLRLPVHLSRCQRSVLNVRLLTPEQVPPGMVYVPAGPFFIGGGDPGARPRRRAELTGFLIDRHEVTFGEYRAWLSTLDPEERTRRAPQAEGRQDQPVVGVTWEDAVAFAQAHGKRLPSEDEWTKAARGPGQRAYSFGERFDPERTNVARPLLGSVIPGSAGDESPYGCHDMSGNVSELVSDLYWPDRPDGPRVRRGGAWALAPHYARLTYRDPIAPQERRRYLGFRCAMDLPPPN